MPLTIENARIVSTMLGREDHGILTCYVHLEGNGMVVGWGGYAFDSWDDSLKRRVGAAYGMEFIAAVLDVAGVERWEQLPGAYVRLESQGWGGRATRIGHITKDLWFDPEALATRMREGAK